MAKLYLGVTEAELGNTKETISILGKLNKLLELYRRVTKAELDNPGQAISILKKDEEQLDDMDKLSRAATKAERGNETEAISILKELKAKLRDDPQELESKLLDARVQLAFAFAKNDEYERAVAQLEDAEGEAKEDERKRHLIRAYRALFQAIYGASREDQDGAWV